MNTFIFLVLAVLLGPWLQAEEFGIGEEYIKPLSYPKFSIAADYSMNRKYHGFESDAMRYDLDNNFATSMSFEAGLVKYFNAGAILSVNIADFSNIEPLHIGFALFGKPYLPLGNRLALFGRLSAGIAASIFNPIEYMTTKIQTKDFYETYGTSRKYGLAGYGGLGSATIGIEFFPLSRIGLAIEWGIKATLIRVSKGNALEGAGGGPGGQFGGGGPQEPESPHPAINYMVYEMPFSLTLHAIL